MRREEPTERVWGVGEKVGPTFEGEWRVVPDGRDLGGASCPAGSPTGRPGELCQVSMGGDEAFIGGGTLYGLRQRKERCLSLVKPLRALAGEDSS